MNTINSENSVITIGNNNNVNMISHDNLIQAIRDELPKVVLEQITNELQQFEKESNTQPLILKLQTIVDTTTKYAPIIIPIIQLLSEI